MTPETIGAVLFLIAFAGAVGGLYKYINSTAGEAAKTAVEVKDELAKYQTRVAETYATKAGMTEQITNLADAVKSVGDRVERGMEGVNKRFDGMNERLDRVIESNHKPTRRSVA
jgi:methyl-accepting chemotaxis protein